MKTVSMVALRKEFSRLCREIYRGNIEILVTHNNDPVVCMVHPSKLPSTRQLHKVGVMGGQAYLTELWEDVQATGGHAVITFHGKPRAVMVPYVEPEAA